MSEGLSESEAQARLASDGTNALADGGQRSALRLLGQVVAEPMFVRLVACGVIYVALGDLHEALLLLGVVFVVMGITFIQQH